VNTLVVDDSEMKAVRTRTTNLFKFCWVTVAKCAKMPACWVDTGYIRVPQSIIKQTQNWNRMKGYYNLKAGLLWMHACKLQTGRDVFRSACTVSALHACRAKRVSVNMHIVSLCMQHCFGLHAKCHFWVHLRFMTNFTLWSEFCVITVQNSIGNKIMNPLM